MNAPTMTPTAYIRHLSCPLPRIVMRPAMAHSPMYPSAMRGAVKMAYSSNVVQCSQSWMTVWPNLEHTIESAGIQDRNGPEAT